MAVKTPATPNKALSLIAAGGQVVVRDEEWLVRSVQHTPADGLMVKCIGIGGIVRDAEATFFTHLDDVQPLRPEDTQLVADNTPGFRQSRLYLESVIRKTPIPATEHGLAVAEHQLLNKLEYQRRAAQKALTGLRPRLLIADAVGLGKTLEVGLILSELIRRGRGDKILVVTPRHILEQFQHELWTRFAIPLVRLDSEGIQRVRRHIPANRNPFTYYKRAIISIDTLKNAGRYRHHLEGIRWDAVVIDECHNLVNKGTLNHQLAQVLAPRTEALLLTSATPHNGDPESFAELIRLLDPTAVVDAAHLKAEDIKHLYVRRHKAHDEVAAEVGSKWADRKAPQPILVEASPAENALFAEIADVWTHPQQGTAPVSGGGRSLFPWTLFKSALSSHHALAQTIEQRRKTIAKEAATVDKDREDRALVSLGERCSAINDGNSSKLNRLVTELQQIGVGPDSPTRVVIFSERIATLDWLAEQVPKRLKLKKDQIRVLHGGMADVKQMDLIEEFGLADSSVRLLFTGDMASEGVNLHRQCHHLIHFDLPWSLIRIEQRNGRIDRYGQEHAPDIRALLLTPNHERLTGDVRILTRLLEREHEAHLAFGEAGSLLGVHSPELEEDAVMKKLREGIDPDNVIPSKPTDEFDLLALISGGTGMDPVAIAKLPSLFGNDLEFVHQALDLAFDDANHTLQLRSDALDPQLVSLEPPLDLQNRMKALPQKYLAEQKINERLQLTADHQVAEEMLAEARKSETTQWPAVGHLSPLHPFMDWLIDKVLVSLGRNQAPVLVADVAHPTYCVQGLYSNGRGQPQLVEWLGVEVPRHDNAPRVTDLFPLLASAGVGTGMANPGEHNDEKEFAALAADLQRNLAAVVKAARIELTHRRAQHDQSVEALLAEPAHRLASWTDTSKQLALALDDRRRGRENTRIKVVAADTAALIDSLRTTGDPLVRVLAVIVPHNYRGAQ